MNIFCWLGKNEKQREPLKLLIGVYFAWINVDVYLNTLDWRKM